MKKYIKLGSGALAILAVVFMFFTQVVDVALVKTRIGVKAVIPTEFYINNLGYKGTGIGLAGYILLGVAGIIMILVALIPYLKEHDVLGMVVMGVAVVCAILGIIFIFLIRKNFAEINGHLNGDVYVGWAAITAGSLGSLSAAGGITSIVLDLLEK